MIRLQEERVMSKKTASSLQILLLSYYMPEAPFLYTGNYLSFTAEKQASTRPAYPLAKKLSVK